MTDLSFLLLFCLFLRSVHGRHVNSSNLISPFNHVNTLPKALSPFNVTSPFNRGNLLHAAPSPPNFPSPFHRGNLHHVSPSPSNVRRHFNRSNLLHAAPSPPNFPSPFHRGNLHHVSPSPSNVGRHFNRSNLLHAAPSPPNFPSHTGASPSVVSGVPLARRYNIGFYVMLGISIVLLLAIIVLLCRYKFLSNPISILKKRTRPEQSIVSFINNYQSPAPMQYRYSEIKKLTNSFQEKIGQGGYGGVFKGKLTDGRLVAVKVFNNSKGNGEDFINEVDTIGGTNHVNIVTLLGYCSEGSKCALIYEFMSNGSLEKYIYNDNLRTSFLLEWENLYQIILGVARGLEYLHIGCTTRILHLDIKPENILLDQDLCPKISDFGLAKLCFTRESVVSMLGFRGTFGYVAPEVYCRNIFPGVSYKSDVYSYGMMLLEIVRGRNGIFPSVEENGEVHFPRLIYKHLEKCDNEGLLGLEKVLKEEISKKMTLVGLWCIQMDPAVRPSMSRVVEMLEGCIDSLGMPANPFLDSTSVVCI